MSEAIGVSCVGQRQLKSPGRFTRTLHLFVYKRTGARTGEPLHREHAAALFTKARQPSECSQDSHRMAERYRARISRYALISMFLGVDGNSISAVLVVFPAIGTCEMRTGPFPKSAKSGTAITKSGPTPLCVRDSFAFTCPFGAGEI